MVIVNGFNFSDPRERFFGVTFHYFPSIALAWIAVAFFTAITVVSIGMNVKFGGRFMWIVPAMGFVEALGYGIRLVTEQQATLTPYLVSTLCILMAPIAMALVNYIVAGKILRVTGKTVKVLWRFNVKPGYIARIFLWGDIICFLLQGAGGGLLAVQDDAARKAGNAIVLFGLSVQLAFFMTFMWIIHRIYTEPSFGLRSVKALQPVFMGLRLTVVCLLVRNVFRLVEFASFPSGPAYTTEWAFYVFETVPIFISFLFYNWYHFGRLLQIKSANPAWIEEYKTLNPPDDTKETDIRPETDTTPPESDA